MNHPSQFAGVISLEGAFPTGRTPLAKLTEARRLPVFVAAGRHSTTYTAAKSATTSVCSMRPGYRSPCGSILVGTNCPLRCSADVNRWMMDQIESAPAATAESDHQWSRETE